MVHPGRRMVRAPALHATEILDDSNLSDQNASDRRRLPRASRCSFAQGHHTYTESGGKIQDVRHDVELRI